MNHQSALHILTAKNLIRKIEASDCHNLRIWEKRFVRRIKSEISKGLGLSTRENIRLHQLYRKSQKMYEGFSPIYSFPLTPSTGVLPA